MSPATTVTLETARALQVGQSLRALMRDERIVSVIPSHVRDIFTEHGEQLVAAAEVEIVQTEAA